MRRRDRKRKKESGKIFLVLSRRRKCIRGVFFSRRKLFEALNTFDLPLPARHPGEISKIFYIQLWLEDILGKADIETAEKVFAFAETFKIPLVVSRAINKAKTA